MTPNHKEYAHKAPFWAYVRIFRTSKLHSPIHINAMDMTRTLYRSVFLTAHIAAILRQVPSEYPFFSKPCVSWRTISQRLAPFYL